ncbi:hypothetical protein [Phreatobacter stygius]|uniref:Uncharacterized protein n=1 Tax=Phreatobacter stygius TaxID=1940610 RepID=A0A4D7B2V7_9HYPH|nr:hypothetical protein [Phreatobacter stygius]QCI63886.1 hypothetical protein E8M01_06275 [Phreatobacter stygius]
MALSSPIARRTLMAGSLAALMSGLAGSAASAVGTAPAASGITLFKVIGPRDEIFIGVPDAELAGLGAGAQAELISRKIAAEGQVSLWRYAVQRRVDGALVMAPMAKVGVFAAGIVRIEPFTSVYPVVAPQP